MLHDTCSAGNTYKRGGTDRGPGYPVNGDRGTRPDSAVLVLEPLEHLVNLRFPLQLKYECCSGAGHD